MPKNPVVAHRLIADVAKGITENLYETLMSNNDCRKAWQARWPGASEKTLVKKFLEQYTEKALPAARATVTTMLQGPYNDDLKQTMADALILDRSLRSVHGAPRQ